MKKLNITKEQFNRSRYFKNKYGTLEYVSESGDVYKTDKGKVLMFVKESVDRGDWMDENLFDLIRKLDDVAIKAKTELKDKELFIKLRGIVNDLTDLRLEGIMGRLGYKDSSNGNKKTNKETLDQFNESDELASILANLIRQASPESQERIMRMLERDADGTDDGKSAGERVRDSYRDDL